MMTRRAGKVVVTVTEADWESLTALLGDGGPTEAITVARAAGTVTAEMSEQAWEEVLFLTGTAIGRRVPKGSDPAALRPYLALFDRVNEGNPLWHPYGVSGVSA